MKIAGRSDIGLVRSSNQDNYTIATNRGGDILALVCDGIGGSKAGDVASLMVTKFVGEAFSKTDSFTDFETAKQWLLKIAHQANDEVFTKTLTSSDFEGMGTTLVGALFFNKQLIIVNVGDSRAYVLDDQDLNQITVDHSLVNDLVASGQLLEEDAENHPQRNILTNALGVVGTLKVDIFEVKEGRRLLLCSDGLSGYVSKDVMMSILNDSSVSLEENLFKLVNAANDAGGYDNITVILADLGGMLNE